MSVDVSVTVRASVVSEFREIVADGCDGGPVSSIVSSENVTVNRGASLSRIVIDPDPVVKPDAVAVISTLTFDSESESGTVSPFTVTVAWPAGIVTVAGIEISLATEADRLTTRSFVRSVVRVTSKVNAIGAPTVETLPLSSSIWVAPGTTASEPTSSSVTVTSIVASS